MNLLKMKIEKSFLFILFFTFLLVTKGYSQETIIPELSTNYVEKLIDTAVANYPKVKAYQYHINIAKNAISKSKLSLLESVTLSYVYQPGQTTINPVSPSTSYFQGFQAGVFLNVGTLLERPYVTTQAKQELLIAKTEQLDYLSTLATEVKKRYYTYVLRLAELKLQTTAVQTSATALKDIKYKFEKGEESFDSYNKLQTDFTNHQTSKIEAEANLYLAKADLEELLGTKLENVK
jgi:outer membrane protein TolC